MCVTVTNTITRDLNYIVVEVISTWDRKIKQTEENSKGHRWAYT